MTLNLTQSTINQVQQTNDQTDWRLEDAFKQGQVDFHTSIPFTRCPFIEDDERSEWQRGWSIEQIDQTDWSADPMGDWHGRNE